MNQIPITILGAKKLQEELEYLKNIKRPEIIQSIIEAREQGDLKENAEYHAAREQQSFCEGRIKEIENKLSHINIIDITKITPSDKVVFGVTVEIKNLDNEEKHVYKIVGDDEANFKMNLISVNSPIARGLIGKKKGNIVGINTPGGKVIYEILKVLYL